MPGWRTGRDTTPFKSGSVQGAALAGVSVAATDWNLLFDEDEDTQPYQPAARRARLARACVCVCRGEEWRLCGSSGRTRPLYIV